MQESNRPDAVSRWNPWPLLGVIRSAAFFAFVYLYLLLEVDLRLIYHGSGLVNNFPVFYTGWGFLQAQIWHPGGAAQYVSAFLAQLFYRPLAGAAVVTCQAWLIWLATDLYIRAIGAPRLRWLRFLGPLVLLAVYSQYTFHLPETVAFLAGLLAAGLFLRWAPQPGLARGMAFLVLSFVLYAAAGGAVLLFAFLCGVGEIVADRRYRQGIFALAVGLALPYLVGVLACNGRPADAYGVLVPCPWRLADWDSAKLMMQAVFALYLAFPVTICLLAVWRLALGRRPLPAPAEQDRSARKRRQKAETSTASPRPGAVTWIVETVGLVALVTGVLTVYHDPRQKALFQADYFSRHGMWSRVLDIGRRFPYHYLLCHATYRALYHSGQMGDAMFSYPQDPNALLMTGKEAMWHKADTCIDLGLVNEAENALNISVETFGEQPLLLQRLALINMIKGDLDTAAVFTRALGKIPFWRNTAQGWLARMASDPNLSKAADVQALRAVRLRQDSITPIDTLRELLAENPANRMAYEYGMAWLLLKKDLTGFAETFNRYHFQNESRIPRHFQEAILLCRALKLGDVDLRGQSISQDCLAKLAACVKALRLHGGDVAGARAAMQQEFGDTYFYYFFLAGSGPPKMAVIR
jgi:hypothetical protein